MEDFHKLTGDEVIAHILVVGFHHQIGHVIEFAYPEMPRTEDGKFVAVPPEWSMLPYISLPDGAHLVEQDAVYFNLPEYRPEGNEQDLESKTLYCVANYRQMSITKLLHKTEDIKRPMIQKAVVVFSRYPCYGAIEERLKPVTLAFFEQGDFSMTEILVQTFETLNYQLKPNTCMEPSMLNMGLSLHNLVASAGRSALTLLKLMLIGSVKIVLFNVSPVKEVSDAIFSLLSLLPGSLQQGLEIRTSEEQQDMMSQYGFPLSIFHENFKLIPYAPVNQFDIMKSKGNFIAGATNSLYLRNPPFEGTLFVLNMSTGEVTTSGPLSRLTSLSTRDQNFMDQMAEQLLNFEKENQASAEPMERYEGSDDWIRDRFEVYIRALLSTVASIPNVFDENFPENFDATEGASDFNINWVRAFVVSDTFREWKKNVNPSIASLPHEHPGAKGLAANLLENFAALRVASGKRIQEANLNEKAANAYDATSQAASAAAAASAQAAAVAAAKVSQFVQDNGPGARAAVASGWSSLLGAVKAGYSAANTAVNDYQQQRGAKSPNISAENK